jgi:glyceraldehyde-3-phosphate dehydrogenase/erythrose-4-phosphate dehydrogenase
MTVRIGINGFGRIGRNVFWPICSSMTRSSGGSTPT